MEEIINLRKNIITLLKTCYDPEIPVNIWDLGLIYGIDIKPYTACEPESMKQKIKSKNFCDIVSSKKNRVKDIEKNQTSALSFPPEYQAVITMTLTSPNCPVIDSLPLQIQELCEQVPGITKAKTELVWEPKWSKDLMSQEALLELGLL